MGEAGKAGVAMAEVALAGVVLAGVALAGIIGEAQVFGEAEVEGEGMQGRGCTGGTRQHCYSSFHADRHRLFSL